MQAASGVGDLCRCLPDADWLVVGWFTPSYRPWAGKLAASLDKVEAPYHLLACENTTGFWEGETMRKPGIVRGFLARYPDKTLILLDADCEARRSLAPLAASVRGDVAAYVRAKATGRGKDRARIKVMSGTMVFRPTAGAASFVDAWERALCECDSTDVDQTALMIALGRATSFTFEPLGAEWCALDRDSHPDPAILQDNASRFSPRARGPLPRDILKGLVSRVRGLMRAPLADAEPGRKRVQPGAARPAEQPRAITDGRDAPAATAPPSVPPASAHSA